MAIEVLRPGVFTTVQDLGRTGYQQYGVPVAGAMDQFALRAANILVGNPETAAGLEITLMGPTLKFLTDCLIAVTGADLGAKLNDRPLPLWKSVWAPKGSILSFGWPRKGARAYLAVAGGIDVPVIMGSRSTYTRGKIGGYKGRSLKQGDVLPLGSGSIPTPGRRIPRRLVPDIKEHAEVRVILGPQADLFPEESIKTFLTATYRVSPVSDRMGYRLEGPKLTHLHGPDIISDAIPIGAVQVPGHGNPIIMLADRQTTGGYAKIATVISADLRLVAQLRPGDTISFRAVSLDEAVKALQEQEEILRAILNPIPSKLEDVLDLLDAFAASDLKELVYAREGLKLELRR